MMEAESAFMVSEFYSGVIQLIALKDFSEAQPVF
jgi:hypothetical protein